MGVASDMAGGARHPWIAVFEADPAKAYDRFIRGFADTSPYERADAPDAARMLFGPLAADDPARAQLGAAITAWLDARRREPIPADRRQRGRLIREISESFEIIRALEPGGVAQWVHDNRIRLLDWTSRLVQSPARDARAAFLLTLAVTQPVVDAEDLTRLWMDICREAGGALPREYLDVGLMGLRRLPKVAQQTSEAPWLAGLAQWAIAREPSEQEFAEEWLALKRVYPRQPAQWRKEISALLRTRQYRDADIEPPAWWACDPQMNVMGNSNFQPADGYRSPMPDECKTLIERLETTPYGEMVPAIESFVQAHVRFARATGISHHLVAAVHQLGMAMAATRDKAACVRAEDLARLALHWQPFDAHAWTLWADALEARGAITASEIVRREHMRRLPFNVDARTQLAEMLIALDRCEEAWTIVHRCFEEGLHNEVVHSLRIRLAAHLDGIEAAREAATLSLAELSDAGGVADYAARLDRGELPWLIAIRYLNHPIAPAAEAAGEIGEGVIARLQELAHARMLGERLIAGPDAAAVAEVAALLAEEPDFAYAQLLAVRAGIWAGEQAELASVPAAFERALSDEDADMLSRLTERAPKLETLTLVARALFGDVDAQDRIADWLTEAATDEPGPVAGMRPRLRVILGGATGADAVAAGLSSQRDKVLTVLRRVNEALIDSDLIAA
jgi:CRP-like cAMP-binding protein